MLNANELNNSKSLLAEVNLLQDSIYSIDLAGNFRKIIILDFNFNRINVSNGHIHTEMLWTALISWSRTIRMISRSNCSASSYQSLRISHEKYCQFNSVVDCLDFVKYLIDARHKFSFHGVYTFLFGISLLDINKSTLFIRLVLFWLIDWNCLIGSVCV